MTNHSTLHPPSGTTVGTTASGTTIEPGRAGSPGRLRADTHLPLVLEANAATSLVAGVVAVAAGRWSADRLGLDDTLWVRLVGAGLVAFALAVAAASRLRGRALARAATLISAADLAWVAATAVVVATADLSAVGAVIAVAMAVGVFDFAALQLFLARRRAG